MPTISIGNNPKKINSTSRSYTVAATLSCRLKEPCSMQAPVFRVQGLTKGALYNYCQFESRYYWIDDIIYLTHNIQEVHCHLDPLATFKTDIGNTYAYIEYGDAAHWNRVIDDTRFGPEIEVSKGKAFESNMFSHIFGTAGEDVPVRPDLRANGTVVFSIMDGGTAAPGVKYYACPIGSFFAIIIGLTSAIDPTQVTTSSQWTDLEFAQYIQMVVSTLCGQGSWVDNILSCTLLPITFTDFYERTDVTFGAATSIWFGGVECNVSGLNVRLLSYVNNVVWGKYIITIPWAEESDPNYDGLKFMRNSRWVSMQINCAGQYHNIDTSWLVDQQYLYVYWGLNYQTGEWDLRVCEGGTTKYEQGSTVYDDLSQTLTSFSGSLGVDIKGLVGSGLSNSSSISNIATGLLSNLIRNTSSRIQDSTSSNRTEAQSDSSDDSDKAEPAGSTMGTIMTAASGIFGQFPSATISASSPSGSASGVLTSLLLNETASMGKLFITGKQWVFNNWQAYGHGDPEHYPNEFCDEYGYPVHTYGKISNFSGYVKCVGASVKGSRGATNNLSTINNFLNTGFYYE